MQNCSVFTLHTGMLLRGMLVIHIFYGQQNPAYSQAFNFYAGKHGVRFFVKRLGIILKITNNRNVILLDQEVGKIFIKSPNNTTGLFVGALISYILDGRDHLLYFQEDSIELLSNASGYCYDKLFWLHELLEVAMKYLSLNDSCKKSFQILCKAIILISRKLPMHYITIMHLSSLASLIATLGYVEDIFLQEFVELFDQYCRLSPEGGVACSVLDLKIKSLEINATHVRNVINTFKKEV